MSPDRVERYEEAVALGRASAAAWQAYYEHRKPPHPEDDLSDERVRWEIEEKRLNIAYGNASRAYRAACDRFFFGDERMPPP